MMFNTVLSVVFNYGQSFHCPCYDLKFIGPTGFADKVVVTENDGVFTFDRLIFQICLDSIQTPDP